MEMVWHWKKWCVNLHKILRKYQRHVMTYAITWYDMRYDHHKIFMLSQLAFFRKPISLFAYKNFHHFLWSFFGQINKCFTQFQAGDRLKALFGVSILEDKGQARNELWDIVYQMSCVNVWFANFRVLRLSTFCWRKSRRKAIFLIG
jgi:hypothetical protein